MKRFLLFFEKSESRLAFLLVLPAAVLVLAILIYPLLYSLFISFTDVGVISKQTLHFVGFLNYLNAFKDPNFRNSVLETLYFVTGSVFIKLIFGLIIAITLNENFKGRGVVRALIILPWATPLVVTGIMWKWMLDPAVGIFNFILKSLHIINSPVVWLGDKVFAMPSVVIADVWQGTPFFVILFLAGLQAIPKDLYEAVEIDGGGSFRKLWSITLPFLKFPIFITVILGTISAINAFDLFFIMTKGGPGGATQVATFFVWMNAFKFYRVNTSAAISYILLILSLIIAVGYIKILRRVSK